VAAAVARVWVLVHHSFESIHANCLQVGRTFCFYASIIEVPYEVDCVFKVGECCAQPRESILNNV
jgi:hypothetical protein